MKYRRPRYMNGGGIASLMSNGGSEAMMLELEGDAAALPGDLFSDEPDPRWLSHPEDEGYLPEARIRRQLQRKGGAQIGEWLEELTDMFDMQEAYDEELETLDPRDPFSSLTPERMKMVGEMIMPGAGMVKMGKGAMKVGKRALKDLRKELDMPKYSSKGQDPRPSALGTERSKPPEIPKYIPKKKPPKMWYGGAPLYKKGYYGKSYK